MNKYILSFEDKTLFNAGLKAPADCEKVFLQNGYRKVEIPLFSGKNKLANKAKNLLKYRTLFRLEKDSVVAIQHPQYIRGIYMSFLKWMKKFRRCKLIFIIHDLESLRRLFTDNAGVYKKLDGTMYEIADIMIAHNEKMKEYMVERCGVPESKIVLLGVFDYLVDKDFQYSQENMTKAAGIIIAGNLKKEKSGYIYKLTDLHTRVRFQLYGVNWEKNAESERNWSYNGAFKPEELPMSMKGAFGLVWDGNDITTCDGPSGLYVQYNNPHKVSLYIAAGIPIIIWDKAALAHFVIENGIGIEIDDLHHMDEVIEGISEEEYESMIRSIRKLSEEVRQGKYMERAIIESQKRLFLG